MAHRLLQLLSSNSTPDGDHEFTTNSSSPQKHTFMSATVGSVFTSYCDIAYEEGTDLTLAETTGAEIPLIIKMSFCFAESPSLYIDDDFIFMLISLMQGVMSDTLNVTGDAAFYCCVISDDQDTVHTNYSRKDIRFQFPYTCVEKSFAKGAFREKFIAKLRSNNIFKHLDCQPMHDWDEIVRKDFLDGPIPLYGSNDGLRRVHSSLIYTVGYIGDNDYGDDVATITDLSKIFIPTNHKYVRDRLISDDIIASQELDYWIPLLLSVRYYTELTHTSSVERVVSQSITFSSSNDPLTVANELIKMFDPSRADSAGSWIDIGRALFKITEGKPDGLSIWIGFSEKGDSYSRDDCIRKWRGMKIDEIVITSLTLEWYASLDDPETYQTWKDAKTERYIREALNLKNVSVAEAIYEIYKMRYACASAQKKIWYRYINHGWNRMDGDVYISRLITGDFVSRIAKYRNVLAQEACSPSLSDDKRLQVEGLIKKFTDLNSKLLTSAFKDQVLKELRVFFYVEGFANNLDADKRLTRCSNGVIEVNEGSIEFRSGKPEDFIGKTTSCRFPEEISSTDESYEKLDKWIRQFFPDEDTRHTFQKDLASILKGGNAEKRLRTMTGDGDNGKSMFVKLMEMALGGYCVKIGIGTLIEGRARSGAANPEIDQCRGARLVVTEEPDGTEEKVKGGIVKMLTGNDNFFSRGLFQDGSKLCPQFKLWLMCNMVPSMAAERATKQRLWLYPMKTMWSDQAPHSLAEQWKQRVFKTDPHFEDGLYEMAPALLKMMYDWYPRYYEEGIPMVGEVKEAITEYWEMNDPYIAFSKQRLEQATKNGEINREAKISVSDIYHEFITWYRDGYPSEKNIPSHVVATKSFSDKFGKPIGGFWYGITFKATVVDMDDVFKTVL